jgi:hypothetical protein
MFTQTDWWRNWAVISAILSIVGLIIFWANPAGSGAISALVFNILILAALLLAKWPPTTLIGK